MARPKAEIKLISNDTIKVVAIGCVAIVVALIVMSITSMTITSRAVVHKLKTSDLKSLADSIGAVVEGRIDRAVDVSLLMTQNSALLDWIISGETTPVSGEAVRTLMSSLVDDYGYDTSFLVSSTTHNYWSVDSIGFRLLDIVNTEDQDDDWFFNTLASGKRYEINIDHNKELNDTFVWINALVGDVHNPHGVAGLGMNLDNVIEDLIGQENLGQVKNEIWLVDNNSVVQLAKDPAAIGQRVSALLSSSLASEIENLTSAGFVITDYKDNQGRIHDIAYKRLKGTGWKLVVQIPRAESLGFLSAVSINTILSCVVILLLVLGVFYTLSNRLANPYKQALKLNQELERKVTERTQELQDKTTKLQDSIDYAKLIQQTILASSANLGAVTSDHFAIFEPRDTVGGDFYSMHVLEEGFVLIVGDCTGHGVPGALLTTAVNAMLGNIVEHTHNPAEILHRLERLIKQTFQNQHEGIQVGLDVGVVFVSNDKRVVYAGAGISLFTREQERFEEYRGRVHSIDGTSRVFAKAFENREFQGFTGMHLYLFTDGITDQPGGDKLLPYGKTRLLNSLAESQQGTMASQCDYVMQAFHAYAGSEPRRDDITMLGIKL